MDVIDVNLLFQNPLAVTTANLRALQTMQGRDGARVKNNFRPTQEIHDRYSTHHVSDGPQG